MACECCEVPCNNGTGTRSDCCCGDEQSIGECIQIVIEGGPTFQLTCGAGGSLCNGDIFEGVVDCGHDLTYTVRLKCEDGVMVAQVAPDYAWNGSTLTCDLVGAESSWFGPHFYECCPFYSSDFSAISNNYDCLCLGQEPQFRLVTITKCPA